MDAERLLARFLGLWKPQRVLALGSPLPEALEQYAEGGQIDVQPLGVVEDLTALASVGRFDLAVVANQLEQVSRRAGAQLLGRLKNLHTGRICVLLAPEQGYGRQWRGNDFIGLGFNEPRDQQPGEPQRFYYYDLGSYNPERRWNNPSGWANPENFRRYRW